MDLVDMRNDVFATARDVIVSSYESLMEADWRTMNWGDVGVIVTYIGVALLVAKLVDRYRKRRGYRMVMKERGGKIDALLTQIINDGLFDAECRGEISRQEVNAKYRELAIKLDLPDLVPKKRRVSITKSEIKARLHTDYATHPKIPGERPPQDPHNDTIPKKFSERLGGFASKFWARA